MAYTNNNTSVLPWYPDQRYQQHRKSYAQDQVWPLVCLTQRMPPFQIYRETLVASPITSCILTHIGTNATYDVTSTIVADGQLNIQAFSPTGLTAYDLIVYPGLVNFTDITTPEGMYEATITDGTNTWYSERFYMKSNLDKHVKISYWHNVPFDIPLSHISYVSPFYNFIHLPLPIEVNRPKYEEEETVVERDGYRFPIYMTSKKVFRIVGLLLPEYMADAMRLIWMHTNVTVEFDGLTYPTDSFRVIFEEFEKPGHLCPVTIEFTTNTVVTAVGYVEDANDGGDYDQTDYNDDHLITG